MALWTGGLAAVMLLAMANTAGAQEPATGPAEPSGQGGARPGVQVSELPIDLDRIHRQMRQPQMDGLNLRYTIDVFGQAPPLLLFTPQDNIRWGRAPYGTPTHQELMNIVTPQHFRSPMMDFSSLLRWMNEERRRDRDER
jgi:hypothetical protein